MSSPTTETSPKVRKYKTLLTQLEEVTQDEPSTTANLANIAALLYQTFKGFSWVGFYILDEQGQLVVGPYQGKLACTRIEKGQGVCGTTVEQERLIRVDNVAEVENHIYCDPDTQSEIVVPVFKDSSVWGVLDIDSHILQYFDNIDERYLQKVARHIASLV